MFIGFLIQWAIGLRAAVAISSERERGTWDALLTSPLEGSRDRPGQALGEPATHSDGWSARRCMAWTVSVALWGTARGRICRA